MSEIEDLLKDVEILRKKLLYIIDKNQGNLVNAEVVSISKILNGALNQYNRVLEEKLKR